MLIAIDPSIKALGWARFAMPPHDAVLRGYGLLRQQSQQPWTERADHAAVVLAAMCDKVTHAVIEYPRIIPGTGKVEAAANSQAIPKLVFCVATVRAALLRRGVEVALPEVASWKGNVPKEITRKRVLRQYPELPSDLDHNVIDAIGLGMWYLRTQTEHPAPYIRGR